MLSDANSRFGWAMAAACADNQHSVLERHIQHLLTRPAGSPPKKPVVRYHEFMYQAETWEHERRVVAEVEWHHGELYPASPTSIYRHNST